MTDSPPTHAPPHVGEVRYIEGRHPAVVVLPVPEKAQALVRPLGRGAQCVVLPFCFLWPEQAVLEARGSG